MSPQRENGAQIYAWRHAKWDFRYHDCSVITRRVGNNPKTKIFSIIPDEGTDLTNKEQLSFCLRSADENLNAFNYFIGFYQLDNIKSGTIMHVIKEIFIIMNLNLSNGRGQTNDGASNMMGRNLEFRLKFLCSSQKLLPYTVKDISSANQWHWWLKNVTFCMMLSALLEKFPCSWSFTERRTFARKHQWQY